MTTTRTLLLFLAMVIAGWYLGSSPVKSIAPTAIAPSTRAVRTGRIAPGPKSEAEKRLASVRAAHTPEDRMRATIELANTLPATDFAAWIDGDRFNLREGMDSILFTNILMERWQNENPEEFLLWAMRHDRSNNWDLRGKWVESEPLRLLAVLKELNDDRTEIEVLGEIARFHPDIAFRRFQEMLARGIAPRDTDYIDELLEGLTENSPSPLAAILGSLPGEIKFKAEGFLIAQKMRTSFTTELRQLWDRPDGFKLFEAILGRDEPGDDPAAGLFGKFFDELPDLPASWRHSLAENLPTFIDSGSAAKWLDADLEGCGFKPDEMLKIRLYALRSLPNEEPESILERMAVLQIPPDEREELIVRIFGSLGADKPEKYEALLGRLPTDEERAFARTSYESKVPDAPTPVLPEIKTSAEWLTAFGAEVDHANGYLFQRLKEWSPEKLATLTQQFNSLPEDQKLKLAPELVQNDTPLRGDALAFLIRTKSSVPLKANPDPFASADTLIPISLDGDDMKARFASSYISGLARKDPEGAGRWISSLPDGSPKLWAAKNLQSLWSQYDPVAADRWMKSLPAATQDEVKALGKN